MQMTMIYWRLFSEFTIIGFVWVSIPLIDSEFNLIANVRCLKHFENYK